MFWGWSIHIYMYTPISKKWVWGMYVAVLGLHVVYTPKRSKKGKYAYTKSLKSPYFRVKSVICQKNIL